MSHSNHFILTFIFIYFSTPFIYIFFFFNDTATTEIYTLSLHDALPISALIFLRLPVLFSVLVTTCTEHPWALCTDRKSTRLNSSHLGISYAVFCLKKKKDKINPGEISVFP